MPPTDFPLRRTPPRRRRTRLALVALLAAAMLLLLGAATALGSPGTMRLIDTSPSLGHDVTVTVPGGETFRVEPGRPLVQVTPSGGAVIETSAWCVDWRRAIDEGVDYAVDLQTPADAPGLVGPAADETAWLIAHSDALIAAAASPGLEAAAIQVAVWQLTGQAADTGSATDDADLNARVAELRALAKGRSPVTSIALAGPGGALVAGIPATVTLSGTPGGQVDLQVSAGQAGLSATSVTLDAGGRAQVVVTPSAAGPVTLTARAEGGLLWRATHLAGASGPQDMAYVTSVPVSATTTLSVGAPVPALAVTPLVRAGGPAGLRLVKSAPASVVRGRSIPYTLTVTNVSARTARDVVLRDPLPDETLLTGTPARARLSDGVVVWRLGDLAPHARVIVHLRLRTVPGASPLVRNVARASAANAATVRARALTHLLAPPRTGVRPAVVPPVTG